MKKILVSIGAVILGIGIITGLVFLLDFNDDISFYFKSEEVKNFVRGQMEAAPICEMDLGCELHYRSAKCGPIGNSKWEESQRGFGGYQDDWDPGIRIGQPFTLYGSCICFNNRCVIMPDEDGTIGNLEEFISK